MDLLWEVFSKVKDTFETAGLNARIKSIHELIDAGENLLAYEIIADNVYEFELPITADTLLLLQKVEPLVHAKPDFLERIKAQVTRD